MRYEVHPISDENCDSLYPTVIAATDDAEEAKSLAIQHSYFTFGTGILDTATGQIDVGFGFGIPCPDPN